MGDGVQYSVQNVAPRSRLRPLGQLVPTVVHVLVMPVLLKGFIAHQLGVGTLVQLRNVVEPVDWKRSKPIDRLVQSETDRPDVQEGLVRPLIA